MNIDSLSTSKWNKYLYNTNLGSCHEILTWNWFLPTVSWFLARKISHKIYTVFSGLLIFFSIFLIQNCAQRSTISRHRWNKKKKMRQQKLKLSRSSLKVLFKSEKFTGTIAFCQRECIYFVDDNFKIVRYLT